MIDVISLASSSGGNAYIVDFLGGPGCPLLLDCGLPINKIKQGLWQAKVSISMLGGCLVTHEHGDHSKAIFDLMKYGDIYTSRGTADAAGVEEPWNHRLKIIKAREQFTVGPWKVLPFETVHDAAEPLGFLIYRAGERLLYATDTAYLPVRFKDLNVIMVECNYALDILESNADLDPAVKKRVIGNHFGLDQVKRFLQANDLRAVREIHLLHLSDGNSDADRFKKEIQEWTGRPVYIAGK